MLDFCTDKRPVQMQLVSGRGHYDALVSALRNAELSVWIATANLKDLMLAPATTFHSRRRAQYTSCLELFDELAQRKVELRILHARLPSQAFRDSFDAHPRLVSGGLELRQCCRVHLKVVVVDARFLYFGSANWTGAGMGVRSSSRRNFELGMLTEDASLVDQVQDIYQFIWSGRACAECDIRTSCEAPLA